jgi:hypothetical protein
LTARLSVYCYKLTYLFQTVQSFGIMRTWQLDMLTEDELALLVHIVNVADPIKSPEFQVKKASDLLLIRHDALLWKCSQQEKNLSDEGKPVFTNLMTKLNMSLDTYFHEHPKRTELIQSEFQF